jgi:GH25 family lysozyme M1 (1,4-beta-N-acetylmuramidase)
MARNILDLEQLVEYPFWLALYSDRMTFEYKVDMWQYTQSGTVPGIETAVDINLYLP